MTYARSHLIDPNGGIYHLMSRCVRRAFLCGTDKYTAKNYDHRRLWIEERILELSEIFLVDLYGYAILHNHYHLVLSVNQESVTRLTDSQVAARWFWLCPPKCKDPQNVSVLLEQLSTNTERIKVLRQRLGSISWFMRFLNESIARRANKEDDCKGRFWEGRFKSQRLIGENSILACMIYVDLNPLRSGIASRLSQCKHTSLSRRLKIHPRQSRIASINPPYAFLPTNRTLDAYADLAEQIWTNKLHPKTDADDLSALMPAPGKWQRAIGTQASLKDYATSLGQNWIRTAKQ